jgi:hypothetical protein
MLLIIARNMNGDYKVLAALRARAVLKEMWYVLSTLSREIGHLLSDLNCQFHSKPERCPSWPKETDCKSVAIVLNNGGSNPPLSTKTTVIKKCSWWKRIISGIINKKIS